ncbi:MAG: 50S ribosomal protein L20 [Bacillota bacterium]
MARVKRAINAHKKRRKIFKLAKGYVGARSKKYRIANETVIRALRFAYIGRKLRKRDFRKLWIARINAAARANGMSYSKFINGLKQSGIEINRKMLAEMAINDAAGFQKLVEAAKDKLNA